ncbi:hydrolase [Mucilaginibacter rubeus]|uniref:Hydrolase n=1 Tax=Mucilaginibacter rubeus TaxID=2027860 RepID=A0A5C1I3H1_9SPHI|nr:hydrolase [Mucilaginibacter rubeus]QEM11721.1 hydrolase [Mucilaginibacter rubeus]
MKIKLNFFGATAFRKLACFTCTAVVILLSCRDAKAQGNPKQGLGALLTPENCAVLLIDHQPFQFATIGSHNTQMILNNTILVAKTAKVFKVPCLLTTVTEERGGKIAQGIQDVYPDQKPINRTFINAWQDQRVVDWVKKTGKKKIVIAGLWTEVCVAMPAIQALGEGYEVYVITDASGGVSTEAHEMAVQRMVQAGVVPITTVVLQAELQRDWARTETAGALVPLIFEHQGSIGTSLQWEFQLLKAAEQSKK